MKKQKVLAHKQIDEFGACPVGNCFIANLTCECKEIKKKDKINVKK